MAWGNYEPTPTLSIQDVWAPGSDPRYTMPVVGTFSRLANAFGQPFSTSDLIDDTSLTPEGDMTVLKNLFHKTENRGGNP